MRGPISFAPAVVPVLLASLAVACQSGGGPTTPSPLAASQPSTSAASPPPPTGTRPAFLTPPEPQPASPTDPVVGRYRLELAIGSDCPGLPVSERTRRYIADIEADRREGYDYVVKLYDASFLEALSCHDPRFPEAADICHQFRASGHPEELRFDFGQGPDDNWRGNEIFELISEGVWLGMAGDASGRLAGSTITAAGRISVERWVGGLGGTPGATYTPCSSPASTVYPSTVRLTFDRR